MSIYLKSVHFLIVILVRKSEEKVLVPKTLNIWELQLTYQVQVQQKDVKSNFTRVYVTQAGGTSGSYRCGIWRATLL